MLTVNFMPKDNLDGESVKSLMKNLKNWISDNSNSKGANRFPVKECRVDV